MQVEITGIKVGLGTITGLVKQGRSADFWCVGEEFVLKWYHGHQEESPVFAHPGLLPILERGKMEGRYYEVYLRMEHTLESYPVDAEVFFDTIGPAVNYLHGLGWIHRDIKPSNILVDGGKLVLGDFGHLRKGHEAQPWVTSAFAAPETKLSYACAGSDWYSIGKIYQSLPNAWNKELIRRLLHSNHAERNPFECEKASL